MKINNGIFQSDLRSVGLNGPGIKEMMDKYFDNILRVERLRARTVNNKKGVYMKYCPSKFVDVIEVN